MGDYDFNPNDNEIPLSQIDWRSRLEQLENDKDWDPKTQFVGIKRLGKTYNMLEPFFKFDGIPRNQRHWDRLWYPMYGAIGTLAISISIHKLYRRNYFGNVLSHVCWTIGGAAFGNLVYLWHKKRSTDRDAVLKHYMIIHEHEFPIIERKTFGEILRPWAAFRPINGPDYERPFGNPKKDFF